MKTIVLLNFLLIFSFNSFSQKELKDYSLSRSLKQDGQQFNFKILDDDKRGVWIYRKDRFYFWCKAQHVLSTQGGASGQLIHGNFEGFYENKQLSQQGYFKKGLKHEEWLYWRTDGTLIKSESWKKGKLRGMENYYNIHGDIIQSIKHSKHLIVKESADSIVELRKNGKLETITLLDSLGSVSRVEHKKNGLYDGKVKQYEDGKLLFQEKYSKGVLIPKKEKKETSEDENSDKKWWQIFKKKEPKSAENKKSKKSDNTGAKKSGGIKTDSKSKDEKEKKAKEKDTDKKGATKKQSKEK